MCFSCFHSFLQNSGEIGAGYETAIKGGALAAGGGKPKSRPASKPGTKKVRRSEGGVMEYDMDSESFGPLVFGVSVAGVRG
jgi:hypothetical protein